MTFKQLGISDDLIKILKNNGITVPNKEKNCWLKGITEISCDFQIIVCK